MRIGHVNLLPAGAITAANFTSQGFYVGHIATFAAQAVFTGSPVGVLKLQVSCDLGNPSASFPNGDDNVLNWVDLSGATASISGAGSILMNLTDSGYSWVRLVYTHTSGSGSLTVAQVNLKGF